MPNIFNKLDAKFSTFAILIANLMIAVPASAANYQFDMSQATPGASFPDARALGAINSGAAAGAQNHPTFRTGSGPRSATQSYYPIRRNNAISLRTGTMGLAPAFGSGGALPPTSLDSFVAEAGGSADSIYGDEGTDDIPPFFGFDQSHRINAGIIGNDAGLTTGHGSFMPNAWGGDEFDMPEGWSMSGSNGGNPYGLGIGFGSGAYGGAGLGQGASVAAGDLAGLGSSLQGNTWAQNHPRQTEVLTSDSTVFNQINSERGKLGGNYNQLANSALSIQSQDLTDAAQNGGYITLTQQAQLDQEVRSLGKSMDKSVTSAASDSGF